MSVGFRNRVARGHAGRGATGGGKMPVSGTVREKLMASLLGAFLLAGTVAAAGGRLAPPETLRCSRDRLTAFSGQVISYKHGPGKIALRLRTDEATTETFTLKFPKAEGPSRRFLIQGGPFRKEDWEKVEKEPGNLRDGMRVIVWICEDDPQPVFDWRPGEGSEEGSAAPAPR